jgi:hypothetical protein
VLRRLRGHIVLCVAIVATSISVTAASSSPTIPVYIFAGQSNMVGSSSVARDLRLLAPKLAAPQSNALFFGPTDDHATSWSRLKAPTEISQASYGPGFGPELSAAAALSTSGPIAIVKFARNGTNLYHDWDPSRSNGLYRALITRTRAAFGSLQATTHRTPRIAGFFWMQGESDTYQLGHAAAYGKNLINFFNHVKTDLGTPQLRVVIGRISTLAGPFSGVVRDEQMVVAKHEGLGQIVTTDNLDHDPLSPMHLNSQGELDLGRRFAHALEAHAVSG